MATYMTTAKRITDFLQIIKNRELPKDFKDTSRIRIQNPVEVINLCSTTHPHAFMLTIGEDDYKSSFTDRGFEPQTIPEVWAICVNYARNIDIIFDFSASDLSRVDVPGYLAGFLTACLKKINFDIITDIEFDETILGLGQRHVSLEDPDELLYRSAAFEQHHRDLVTKEANKDSNDPGDRKEDFQTQEDNSPLIPDYWNFLLVALGKIKSELEDIGIAPEPYLLGMTFGSFEKQSDRTNARDAVFEITNNYISLLQFNQIAGMLTERGTSMLLIDKAIGDFIDGFEYHNKVEVDRSNRPLIDRDHLRHRTQRIDGVIRTRPQTR